MTEPRRKRETASISIVVEIPHRLPASAWIAWGDADLIAAACAISDNARYTRWTQEELAECFGAEGAEIPPDALAVVETEEAVMEITGIGEDDKIWRRVYDPPTEVDWATQVLASDLHALHLLRSGQEVRDFVEKYSGHQAMMAIKATIAAHELCISDTSDYERR